MNAASRIGRTLRPPWPPTVRGRIVFGLGLLVLILSVVVAGSAWLAREHRRDLAAMEGRSTTVSLLQSGVGEAAYAMALLELYVATGDETVVPEVRSSLATAIDNLHEAQVEEKASGDEQQATRLNEFAVGAAFASDFTEQIIALRASGDTQGAAAAVAMAAPRLLGLKGEFDEAFITERREAAALRDQADRTGRFAFWLLVVSGALGAAAGLIASLLIARSILRPLTALEAAAEAVAAGDLEARAEAKGPGELARLAGSLNRMTEALLCASKRRELEKTRQRLSAILEATPDLVGIADADGRGLYLNAAGRRMLGIDEHDAGEHPDVGQFHPGWVRELLLHEALPAAVRGGSWSGETVLLARDGRQIPVSQVIIAHRRPDGPIEAFSTIARDITERKRAEEALRESERYFRSLIENASDMIAVVGADGTVQFESPSVERIGGYRRGELVGTNALDLVHPDDLPRVTVALKEALQDWGATRRVEYRFRCKDGSWRFAEAVGMAVSDRRGEAQIVVNARDITERKRAEEALRESEERHRAVLEDLPVLICRYLPDGTITFVNEAYCRYFGRRCDELIGNSFLPLVHEDDRQAVEAAFGALTPEQPLGTIEHRVITGKGEVRWQRWANRAVVDGERLLEYQSIGEDVTDRRQAEEEMRRLHEELECERRAIEALNRSLERKVRERTRELRRAHEELQQRHRELLDARAQAATDGLTGLRNHRAFHERIRDEVACAQAGDRPLGLVVMDIDSFKGVNDSLGHLAGDDVLRSLSAVLTGEVAPEDVYRYGGDEFAVVLPNTGADAAENVAERLRRRVQRRTNGAGDSVTVSAGVASFPELASTAEELIYGADAAMYWAKSAGKDRVGHWGKLMSHVGRGTLPWYAADRGVKAPDVVAALVAALSAKDPSTSAHTERCSWYAGQLAEELALGEEERSIVKLAALLHDIGKLAVPDEVLFKPGPLNAEEWEQMKKHPTAALHVLGQIRSIASVTPAVLHHHEHFDGSGYPDGLAGDQIPVASRILLVSDAFDAMTTDRPYRKALPQASAVEELKRKSGSQFDPEIVGAFLRILERRGAYRLRAASQTPSETGPLVARRA